MTFLKFLGCFAKSVLGFVSFLGGAVAVLVLGLPYSLGRGAVSHFVEEFNDTYEGRLEVDESHLLDLFGRQEVEQFELRDPEGRTIARGSVEASSILGSMRDGLELRVHVEEAKLVRGRGGVTNLERALTPRDQASFRGRSSDDSLIRIDGEAPDAEDLARLAYGLVREADVLVEVLEFEDLAVDEVPCVVEARDLSLSWSRRPAGSSKNGGDGSAAGHLGVSGRLASGRLDLRLALDDWGDEAGGPRWRSLEVELYGANSHAADPWLRRAGYRGSLEADLGPTLGNLRLDATNVDGARSFDVDVTGNGLLGKVQLHWAEDHSAFVAEGDDALSLRFDDDSRFARAVVPRLLPHVGELVPADGASSVLESRRFRFGRGEGSAWMEGELVLDLASLEFHPAAPFDELEELAEFEVWTIVDEPIPLAFEGGGVRFEVANEGEAGAWILHGSREFASRDLEAAVRLPGSLREDGEPTIVRLRVVNEQVSVAREED